MRNTLACLILILGFGLVLTSCMGNNCPPVEGSYFDIQGIKRIDHLEQISEHGYAPIPEGGEISFEDYNGFSINYSVSYLSQNNRNEVNGRRVLYATDCINSGSAGSKNEKLKQITVVTLYDFNSTYLAGDTINSLISLEGKPLDEYLAINDDVIDIPSAWLNLMEAPSLGHHFKVNVVLQLNTGEVYEAESSTVTLTN